MVDKQEQIRMFTKWLRSRLLVIGISARDLSIASGVDESEVSRLTRGVRLPSLRTIRLFAPHLKCTEKELLIARGLEPDCVEEPKGQ